MSRTVDDSAGSAPRRIVPETRRWAGLALTVTGTLVMFCAGLGGMAILVLFLLDLLTPGINPRFAISIAIFLAASAVGGAIYSHGQRLRSARRTAGDLRRFLARLTMTVSVVWALLSGGCAAALIIKPLGTYPYDGFWIFGVGSALVGVIIFVVAYVLRPRTT